MTTPTIFNVHEKIIMKLFKDIQTHTYTSNFKGTFLAYINKNISKKTCQAVQVKTCQAFQVRKSAARRRIIPF